MSKGGSNERAKCRDWSLWWSEGLGVDPPRDDIFYRTAGSGSRGRMRAKLGKSTAGGHGDMQSQDPVGDPLIQCCTFEMKKGYNETSILACLDSKGKKPVFRQFLDQVSRDANDAGNEPVLIIHRDYMLPCIVMRDRLFLKIRGFCGDFFGGIIRYSILSNHEWTVVRLGEFFNWASPQFFVMEAGKREEDV